jgi:hypothetical protein
VIFEHPFTLGAAEELYPPGRYTIETAEESVERGGHTAHFRTATALIVPTASGTRTVQVRGNELQVALETDAERQLRNAPSENPGSGSAENAARQMPEAEPLDAQLERYGIERVPADVFVHDGYRYTHVGDAIAAAKRSKVA